MPDLHPLDYLALGVLAGVLLAMAVVFGAELVAIVRCPDPTDCEEVEFTEERN